MILSVPFTASFRPRQADNVEKLSWSRSDRIVFKASIGDKTYAIKVVCATNLLFFHGQYLGLT